MTGLLGDAGPRTNEHGQPVGRPVDWSPRPVPAPVRLQGAHVHVEGLTQEHAEDLHAALCGADDDPLWTYLSIPRPADVDAVRRLVDELTSRPDAVAFAIMLEGRAVGTASLMRIDPANGSVEVGWICLGRVLQRTRASTEAMALLMRHVFDDLGYRRYEWKCDSLNAPSRAAALRLGFTEEGTFRDALVYKGRNRDTAWFSITAAEWPTVGAALEEWLGDANVDADGGQLRSLADVRSR